MNARRKILLVQMGVQHCTASMNAIPGSHTQLRSFPCSPARAFIPGHQPLATPDRYHPAGGAVLTIQSVCWQINAHFRADAGARSGSAGPRIRPTLMRDRKRKIPDRKSAVSDLAKSFSFREQKLSYVRSKNRLGFTCGVSCIPLFASSNADR